MGVILFILLYFSFISSLILLSLLIFLLIINRIFSLPSGTTLFCMANWALLYFYILFGFMAQFADKYFNDNFVPRLQFSLPLVFLFFKWILLFITVFGILWSCISWELLSSKSTILEILLLFCYLLLLLHDLLIELSLQFPIEFNHLLGLWWKNS